MQYRKDRKGEPISLLGYGCMRFSGKAGGIDIDKAEAEILEAVKAGVNYFDTAYIYLGSEAALGTIVRRSGLRDKIKIATKLPQYLVGSRKALDRFFDEQLSRLQTDYIDYYLMHHLTDIAAWEKLKEIGITEWISEKKKSGQIRNIGFSFHGDSEMFTERKSAGRFEFAQTVGLRKQKAFASQCIGCGKCEQHCPQNIAIREELKKADKALRPLPYRIGIAVARRFMLKG